MKRWRALGLVILVAVAAVLLLDPSRGGGGAPAGERGSVPGAPGAAGVAHTGTGAEPASAKGETERRATARRVAGSVLFEHDRSAAAGALVWMETGREEDDFGAERARVRAELRGTNVLWLERAGRLREAGTRRPKYSARSDGAGRFELEVPDGVARAVLRAEGDALVDLRHATVDLAAATAGAETVLWVKQAGAIAGLVRGPDGAPVEGAEVCVMPPNDLAETASASTDAKGRFRIGALVPGDYEIVARTDRLVPSRARMAAVAPGETAEVDVDLLAGASIAGRALFEDGSPVAGARVEAGGPMHHRVGDLQGMRLASHRSATTDAEGRFVVQGLPPGEPVDVRASHAGALAPEPLAGLDASDPASADLRLVFERGRTLAGRVVDAGGRPVEGLLVTAASMIASGSLPSGPSSRGAATSGEDGRFRIGGLGDGLFDVRGFTDKTEIARAGAVDPASPLELRVPRHAVLEIEAMEAASGAALDAIRVRVLRVERVERGVQTNAFRLCTFDASNRPWRVEPMPPGEFEVRVEADGHESPETVRLVLEEGETRRLESRLRTLDGTTGTITGRIVARTTGEEVRGVRITPLGVGMGGFVGATSAWSDTEGRFRVERVPAGDALLRISHERFGDTVRGPWEIAAGASREVLVALAAPGAIEGALMDPSGGPIAGASLVAWPGGPLGGHADSSRPAVSDERGRFRIALAAPGPWSVHLHRLPESAAYARASFHDWVSVEVPEGGVGRAELRRPRREGTTVRGVVLDAGEPVAGAWVTCLAPDRPLRSETDARGRFEILGVDPGSRLFSCERRGRPFSTEHRSLLLIRTVDVPESGPVELRWEMPLTRVTGRVADARTGAPLVGARVSVRSVEDLGGEPASRGSYMGVTDGEGRFDVRALPAGAYRVSALPPVGGSLAPCVRSVAIEDPGTSTLDLALGEGATLEITVRDGSGAPVGGAPVSAASREGDTAAWIDASVAASCDPRGLATLVGVAPGVVVLRAGPAPGLRETEREVVTAPGETLQVDLVLPSDDGER